MKVAVSVKPHDAWPQRTETTQHADTNIAITGQHHRRPPRAPRCGNLVCHLALEFEHAADLVTAYRFAQLYDLDLMSGRPEPVD
jgi:hypothetical protein